MISIVWADVTCVHPYIDDKWFLERYTTINHCIELYYRNTTKTFILTITNIH